MSTATKLTYLNETKSQLKDMINYGLDDNNKITSSTTFRNYVSSIFNAFLEALRNPDTLFTNLPKKSGTGANITLNDTANAPMRIELGASELTQETTTGKNLFNKNNTHSDTGVSVTSLNTGIRVTLTQASNYRNTAFVLGGSELLGKTITQKTIITPSASNSGAVYIYLGSQVNTAIERIIGTSAGTNTRQFPIPNSFPEGCDRVWVLFYGNVTGTANIGDYVDYTDLMLVEGSYTSDNFPAYEPYTGEIPAPNPDFPMTIHTISGDNSIKVCGKNLFDKDSQDILENVRIGADGGNNADSGYFISEFIEVTPNTKYTKNTTADAYHRFAFYTDKSTNSFISKSENNTITTPSNAKYLRICGLITEKGSIQLEKGNQATTCEAYTGESYPINLGDIELCKIGDYQDSIVKDNGKWYLNKQIGKVVLDGSESYTMTTVGDINNFYYQLGNVFKIQSDLISYISNNFTAYGQTSSSFTNNYDGGITFDTTPPFNIRLKTNIVSTVEDFKTWLSTHNTTVYYVLETPTYTLLNDTLQEELDIIENTLLSYKGQTSISQENDDLPFDIVATALKDLSSL